MRLQNNVAIITGAGTGIGEAIAHKFAREGARLVLSGQYLVEPGFTPSRAALMTGQYATLARADEVIQQTGRLPLVVQKLWGRRQRSGTVVVVGGLNRSTQHFILKDRWSVV